MTDYWGSSRSEPSEGNGEENQPRSQPGSVKFDERIKGVKRDQTRQLVPCQVRCKYGKSGNCARSEPDVRQPSNYAKALEKLDLLCSCCVLRYALKFIPSGPLVLDDHVSTRRARCTKRDPSS